MGTMGILMRMFQMLTVCSCFMVTITITSATATATAGGSKATLGRWNIERVWERVPVDPAAPQPLVLPNDPGLDKDGIHYTRNDEEQPWPLLVPRRTEKTVLFKIWYDDQKDPRNTKKNDEERQSEEQDEFYFCQKIDDHPADDLASTNRRVLEDATDRNATDSETASEPESEHHDAIHIMYEDIYDTLIFLAMAWIAGKIALWFGMPTLVGEIVTGFILGPPLANYVPMPSAMVLIGEIGLIGLLLEAGIEMDVGQLKETGVRSFAMAFTGAMIPLGMGIGLAAASGADIRAAIALGAIFSPTSLGVASNALNAGSVANTPVGQLIVSTCVCDDIIGLVLLSMLEVIVRPDAQIYEYFIPIISSSGYLLLLGWSAVTWIPKVLENKFLPLFPEQSRDVVAFGCMFLLALGYLPLLFYSKSSYLTGAFLAGLSFSQIHSIHTMFSQHMSGLLNWLLRIFFAASIGFQVPVKSFGDGYIVKWGFIFYIIVLGKIPLGLFVPRFQDAVPDNFPYNPYIRDVLYVSVGMTCRGEFSFVIANFALQAGLFTRELYSAAVFAVLLSSITSPFILLSLIKYYNRKNGAFLELLQDQKATTTDGKMPLYLAIQARTPNQWGLQETIHTVLKREGTIIIDHRSWHPRGLDATVMTELYVEDSELRVPIQKMKEMSSMKLDVESTTEEAEMAAIIDMIDTRCAAIRKALEDVMGHPDETRVVVTWWQPAAATTVTAARGDGDDEEGGGGGVPHYDDMDESLRNRLKTEAQAELTTHENFGISLPDHNLNLRRRRRDRMVTPNLGQDMWASDGPAQQAGLVDAAPPPAPVVVAGRYRYGTRRRIQSDISGFLATEAAPLPEERLAGFVRRETQPATPEFGLLHPGEHRASSAVGSPKPPRERRTKNLSDLTGLFDRSKRVKTNSDITGLQLQPGGGDGGVGDNISSSNNIINEAIQEEEKETEDEGKK